MKQFCIVLFLFCLAPSAFSLGPHEILLLVNRNAPFSGALAREYAAMRHIPEPNIIPLDLPANPPLDMSAPDFNRLIWEPARKECRARGLDDHILAWVYSVNFPIRITTTPALSIQGLTFLKGVLPAMNLVERGTYVSPLFAGPDSPASSGFPPQSFDVQREWLGKDMPIPSMMLGFMGKAGNTSEEILSCLHKGVRADLTRPDGAVCIVTNSDIRSLCRQWEFAPTIRELHSLGITAMMTNAYPSGTAPTLESKGLMGLMAGSANIPEAETGCFRFLPGAIAEHLTSFGAAFDNPAQTKITAWIRAGATASAGTVVEPMSLWPKFPHARVFVHPAAGCTLIESFYQSLRCPLQILIVGEPLASPWGAQSTVSLRGLEDGAILTNRQTVTAEIMARNGEQFSRYLFLLDGRTAQPPGRNPDVTLDPAALRPGRHTLRVVAYRVGSVRCQIFSEMSFEVK